VSEKIPEVDMDPRQQRSREQLHAAVLDLAAARSISEVSVTEIATAAGIHRSTFYEHAASAFDLLEQALTAELDQLRAPLADVRADEIRAVVTVVTRGVLHHVLRHRDIYRRGLGEGSGAASLHPMLSRHFRESGRVLFDQARLTVRVPGVAGTVVADAAGRFLAEGTVGQISGWLEGPEPDVGRFLEVYLALLPDWWPADARTSDGIGV
jgi:AcrR family transcriptional regulator